jgi:hypothetical protein
MNIGGGDTGSIAVNNVDGKTTSNPDSIDLLIGEGKDIKGKKITITTTVSDINPDEDSVVAIDFNNISFQTLSETVTKHELILYITTINFK